MSERGSILPLVAGFLSLIVLAALLAISSLTTLVTSQRVQGIADAAVIYGHDWSQNRGVPNSVDLEANVREFLANTPSLKGIKVTSVNPSVSGDTSRLRICAIWQDPLLIQRVVAREICRTAQAKSFVSF